MSTETQQAPAVMGPMQVAKLVEDVKSFDPGVGSYSFTDLGAVVKFADLMSKAGEMLPPHLRQKPALCMAVTMRATHWGFDPFALAMETYQAKEGGPIGYQAKVFTAALARAGVRLRYRYEGAVKMLDKAVTSSNGKQIAARTATGDRKCIAYAVIDGETLEYETLTLDQTTIKNSPLWHNDPDQQLAYVAGRGWARRYRSDLIMGAHSDDEVREMRDVTPPEPALSPLQMKAQRARQQAQPIQPEPDDPPTYPHWTENVDLDGAIEGSEAWVEGEEAAKAGKDRQDCPHDGDELLAADWLAGFDGMRRAME